MANKSKFGYLWVTLFLFIFSLAGHWLFGWYTFVEEQKQHDQPAEFMQYAIEMGRDTLENWQSEFLQLMWQVVGLSFLWYVGSPQSKEGDDRKEEKLDAILRRIDPSSADSIIRNLDERYPRQ